MPKCKPGEEEANLAIANTLPRDYYTGITATILAYDEATKEITFSAPGSEEQHRAVWGDLKYMWLPCPCPFPSDATLSANPAKVTVSPPTLPESGALSGELYLEKSYVDARAIYKSGSDPKWPRNLAGASDVKPMKVCATRLLLSGFEMMTASHAALVDLDLMDLDYGSPVQRNIAYDEQSKTFTVWLTELAWNLVGVPFAGFKKLAAARTIIEAPTSTAAELAWAWRIVARCEQEYADAGDRSRLAPEDLAALRAVLGDRLPG